METQRFNSVGDAAAFLCEEETVKSLVEEEIEHSLIINRLLQIRIEKEVSQKELARRMGCDPSKISRMEAGNDTQLKIGDVMHYVSALGIQMNMIFEDTTLPVAEQIKYDVFSIHEKLERLVLIAKEVDGDEVIINKIDGFYREVLINFMLRFANSHEKLKVVTEKVAPSSPNPDHRVSGTDRKKSGKKCVDPSCC